MNKITDNEIIKALERMSEEDTEGFSADILDLINRLKAENNDLFYKLQGVMLSVDKWLEGVELEQDEVNRAATMREKTLRITEEQQAEIEEWKTLAHEGKEKVELQEIELQAMRSAANSLKFHLKKYQDIESTIDEFWNDLQRLSMFKGKDKPTLEELLEYIEQVKVEAHKEFAEKLKKRKQMFPRADGVVHAVSVSTIDRILAERVGDNNV